MVSKKVNEAVEILVFEVKNNRRDEFIKLDHEIWTNYLSRHDGFIKKEVIVSEKEPNKVWSVIYWNSVEQWKNFPLEKLIEKDKEFTEKFGADNFKLIGEIHNDHDTGLFKVLESVVSK